MKVVVLDYGSGNLRSAERALARVGADVTVTADLAEAAKRVVLWGRTVVKAEDRLARLGLSGRADTRAFDLSSLDSELGAGDVVVSMLPAAEHAALLRLCIERGAHFACSSYVSDEILAEAPAAKEAGIVVLTEAGLDPGIDHLLAHKLVAQARAAIGDVATSAGFTSYCGGLPAVPNEFRYRFSWAPRGVLTALCSPARFVADGVERIAERPWEATRPHLLSGETFEVYPNRDSVPFVEQYGIPPAWSLNTFVRGTLRLDGWRDAWSGVFDELRNGDSERIAALADELAARYPTTDADRDRVVLAVALSVRGDGGAAWSGEYVLDVVGVSRRHRADATSTAITTRSCSLPASRSWPRRSGSGAGREAHAGRFGSGSGTRRDLAGMNGARHTGYRIGTDNRRERRR